nr:ABC transporter ATP-binding protein [Pseudonocardia nigra]
MRGRDVLRAAIRDHRRTLLAASALLVAHQAGEALVPVVIGFVIDAAVTTGSPGALLGGLALLGVVFAGLSTSYRFGARRAWWADVNADRDLRLRLTRRVLDPRGGAEAGRPPGELVSVAVGDAKRVGVALFAIPDGVAAVAALVVVAVALLRISLPLGLLILLGSPPLLYLVHLLGRPLERRSGPEQERAARASGVAADVVGGIRVLKGLGAEDAAVARYTRTSQESLAATLRATGAHATYGGAILAANGLFLALVALVGGRLAADGAISVGELVAAVGLAQFLLGPLSVFGWVNGALAQARASADRVAAVLATAPAVEGGTCRPAEPVRGAVTLRGLTGDGLTGLELSIRPGELLGVVVPDPAAASALAHCLAREADPAAGAVELDGRDLRTLDPAAARAAVLVAAHEAHLFSGTVAENVTAVRPGTDADPALAAAHADQPGEAVVTARGRSLSGGQRQRVALARALAADAPVLVLHDPTTAVDTVTEAGIAERLREFRDGRTTVLLTTSPALLAVTDRVVLVDGGEAVVEGSHTDLVGGHEGYRAAVLAS